MNTVYSYADPDGTRFDNEDDAIARACEKTNGKLWTGVIAIWREWYGGAELVALVYGGEVYRA